jgi:uncharacterized protein YhaN
MASSAGSRTGLITALVVVTIVALTSMVFAFIFSAEARRKGKDLEDLTRAYAQVIPRNALSGPTVTAIRERAQSGETVLNAAVRERDDLAKLLGGQDPGSAQTAAVTALTQAATAMKAAGLTEPSTTENMAGTVTQMANALTTLSTQVADLTKTANDAKAQAAATVADATKQLAEKDAQIAQVRADAAKAVADAQQDRMNRQGVVDEINKDVEAERRAMADAMAQLTQRSADLERTRQRLTKELGATQQKLAAFRPDAAQSTVRQADGSIARVSTDAVVYISLGAGQQIVPGMTFEVYGKVEGVPPLAGDETTMPKGKASIEVVRVGPNSSEARVVRVTPGTAITEGDVIANLVYDRNTKYNFVVFGKFDLTKPGTPDSADATILRRLIGEWGGNVTPDIDVETDFLVIGAEPAIPEFNEEQRRDPVNAKILADAQAELDAYYAILNKARELYIPVLNQNRFLYYTGYFEQSKR